MSPYLLSVFDSVIFLMEVDEPSVVPRIGCDDVMSDTFRLILFGFSGNIASVRDVFDTQR